MSTHPCRPYTTVRLIQWNWFSLREAPRRTNQTTTTGRTFDRTGGRPVPSRERYLRTSEVAMQLQVSPKTVARWAKEGRLPYLATLGGHRRFPASVIERMVGDLTSIN